MIIHKADTKAGLYDTTGALVVDMETQIAARFAAKRNLPLAALRVISDDATMCCRRPRWWQCSRMAASACAKCCGHW